jgi:hypothetical protein
LDRLVASEVQQTHWRFTPTATVLVPLVPVGRHLERRGHMVVFGGPLLLRVVALFLFLLVLVFILADSF